MLSLSLCASLGMQCHALSLPLCLSRNVVSCSLSLHASLGMQCHALSLPPSVPL